MKLPAVSEQARLECGELTKFITGTKKEIIYVVSDTADKFHKCKAKHGTVVKEYENLEEAVKAFNSQVD